MAHENKILKRASVRITNLPSDDEPTSLMTVREKNILMYLLYSVLITLCLAFFNDQRIDELTLENSKLHTQNEGDVCNKI